MVVNSDNPMAVVLTTATGTVSATTGPWSRTNVATTTSATTNRFVTSTNMSLTTYTIANSGALATSGAAHVTVTHTTVAGADTLGTITIVGTNLAGAVQTESITPLAGTIATGLLWFKTVTSATSVGWVATSTADTIVIGCAAERIVAEGAGTFHIANVNTTAAGAITIQDSAGTIAILASSTAVGPYQYDCTFAGYLSTTHAAASDVTYMYAQ